MAFPTTHKNLGKIKAGTKHEISFPYDDTVQSIGAISVSCGCTGASHYPVNREIVVNYKPVAVPQHLKGQGYYYSRNHATVYTTLNDGTTIPFLLSFEAIVY